MMRYGRATVGSSFVRTNAQFYNSVTRQKSLGLTGKDSFPAGTGRYHVYASLGWPWGILECTRRIAYGKEGHATNSWYVAD